MMLGPDPELVKAMMAADTKYYDEMAAKYGEAKAATLSELANLGHLAKIVPLLHETVMNLIPHTIRAMGLPMEEALLVIRRYQELRRAPAEPTTRPN